MKTIKIIDLLNKIANGEIKLGTRFIWHYQCYDVELVFTQRHGALGLFFEENNKLIGLFERFNYQILNNEVEIIEEEKEIEKVNLAGQVTSTADTILANKINELIEAVNEIKRG